MIFRVSFFSALILLCVLQTEVPASEPDSQMDTKTLIQLLNYSKTLIQDGEIQFLYYQKFPTHPDDVGEETRMLIAAYEEDLREVSSEENLRKRVLGYLEDEKKYGGFRGSEKDATFFEGHLVFQVPSTEKFQQVYRITQISRFENYPSFGHLQYFSAGGAFAVFSKGPTQNLVDWLPNQFTNDRARGTVTRDKEYYSIPVIDTTYLPPSNPIDENHAQMSLLKTDNGETIYIITHLPFEKTKAKVYVRLKAGLPEVFREEYYYQSSSPHADAEGYWLRLLKLYRNFERIETLNIAFPKVREDQEFRDVDRFMRMHSVVTIKEMDFNLGLPTNFFDWDEAVLVGDDGKRKFISDDPLIISGGYEP